MQLMPKMFIAPGSCYGLHFSLRRMPLPTLNDLPTGFALCGSLQYIISISYLASGRA